MDGTELEVVKTYTKKETAQIIGIHRKMALEAQQLFIKSFGFKKVDQWFLEKKLEEKLFEVRIAELLDSVTYSIRIFQEGTNNLIYQGESLEDAYYITKYFFKKARVKK